MMFGKNRGVDAVLPHIPVGSVGIEIGVWKGDSSERFLERASHLHLVDPWSVDAYRDSTEFGGFREFLERYAKIAGSDESSFQKYYNGVYDSVCSRFAGRPVSIHRQTSRDFFGSFADRVDWVYIDGAHSYEGCLADLKSACKIAAVIFGDDYGNKPGVTQAINEFLKLGADLTLLGSNQYRLT